MKSSPNTIPSDFQEAIELLQAMLDNQKFDSGGHLVQKSAPNHSTIIRAKMLINKLNN
jgi:hypothetical protein